MTGISKAISDELFLKCNLALKQQGKSGKVARKLQAIISAKNHNISQVATIFGVSRATLFKWIKDFESESIDGLLIKQGRGRKPILNTEHQQIVKTMISNNPNISAKELQQKIKKKLSIKLSIASTYRTMHKLGFSYITARKNHYKQNKEQAYAFKKTKANTQS